MFGKLWQIVSSGYFGSGENVRSVESTYVNGELYDMRHDGSSLRNAVNEMDYGDRIIYGKSDMSGTEAKRIHASWDERTRNWR